MSCLAIIIGVGIIGWTVQWVSNHLAVIPICSEHFL